MVKLTALAAACALATAAGAANPLQLALNADGSYAVAVAGWTTLKSGLTGYMSHGAWAPGLVPTQGAPKPGADAWGTYTATTVTWSGAFATTFKVYDDVPAIQFIQTALQDIVPGGGSRENVSTAFPSWVLPAPGAGSAGFLQFRGAFIDDGSTGEGAGTFDTAGAPLMTGGLKGGPFVLFDAAGANALVMSPSTGVMSTSFALVGGAPTLAVGALGSVDVIPAGHSSSTVLWYGNAGINPTIMAWGSAMLAAAGKGTTGPSTDYTNSYLMYNTDHGAYYYYNTGNKTYTDVLTAAYEYAQTIGVPYKAILLDSWWYYKGAGDGVNNWTATPEVFPPGGSAGLRSFVEATGWKVTAHNRFWADTTPYAKQNGGTWDFFVDNKGSGNMAVPLEQAFWEWLLPMSATEWGMNTYEQDWLFNELEGVSLLTTNITAARTWLMQMQAGAAMAGATIQFCMPYPRHVLQSVEMPAVTQVRASDDHVPGSNYYHMQWRIGYSSLLAWALALAPFKDNYWSTSLQPGSSVGNALEISPALHQAISVFSAGPVSPGDGVGYSDAVLIRRTCTAGGRLLQPSRAATAIDACILNRAFPSSAGTAKGEIYATYSLISGWAWDHVLAAQVNATYALTPADLAPIRADARVKDEALPAAQRLRLGAPLAPAAGDLGTVAYSVNATSFEPASLVVQPFAAGSPVQLRPCGEVDFAVWHTAPVFANGIAVLGDLTKVVPMAPARVRRVDVAGPTVTLALVGEPGEQVPITFWSQAGGAPTTVGCAICGDGTATLALPAGGCTCA